MATLVSGSSLSHAISVCLVADTVAAPPCSLSSQRNGPLNSASSFLPDSSVLISKPSRGRGRALVHPRLVIKAVNDGSFLKNIGTQFFKVGDRKETVAGTNTQRSGTQLFNFGKKKNDEAAEESKSATQRFKLAPRKGAGTQSATVNGSLTVRTEGTALDALSFGRGRRVDSKTVFVAGATGQIGARISQQLLQAGFNVRAGVPELYVAQQLAEFATQYGVISRDEAKRLNAIEFDFKNVESIAKALGNAGKVVVTVGPTEDGPRSKVSSADALRVLEAAKLSNASHFVLVTESGTGVSAENGPLAGLSALISSLFSRVTEISESDLIDKIVESDLTFTVVKAGSTDGVDDHSPEIGNLAVQAEGAADPSAKVSKIQVAMLVAGVLSNTPTSANKVVEVSSSNVYAPARPVDELLGEILVDGRRALLEERRAQLASAQREKEIRARVEAEAQEAVEEARKAAQLAAKLESESKKLAAEEARAAQVAARAQARAAAASASLDDLTKELGGVPKFNKPLGGRNLGLKVEGKSKGREVPVSKEPFFSFPKPQQQPVPASVSQGNGSPQGRGFLGGLFGPQETLYVDDD